MDKLVLLLFPVLLLALLPGEAWGRPHDDGYHTDANECRRMKKHDNLARLDSTNGKPATKHFEDGAFVHMMMPVKDSKYGMTDACKDPKNWGYDKDKVTVWAKNGCKAEFLVGYVQAFCGNVTIDSNDGYQQRKMSDMNNPCYDNAAAYNMKIVHEFSEEKKVNDDMNSHDHVSKCGIHRNAKTGKIDHTGLGNKYGFAGRTVWADDGCWGRFQVCEVGTKMDHDMIMHR